MVNHGSGSLPIEERTTNADGTYESNVDPLSINPPSMGIIMGLRPVEDKMEASTLCSCLVGFRVIMQTC